MKNSSELKNGPPLAPIVGCDVFVLNSANKLLLIKRSDNGLWALPGECKYQTCTRNFFVDGDVTCHLLPPKLIRYE